MTIEWSRSGRRRQGTRLVAFTALFFGISAALSRAAGAQESSSQSAHAATDVTMRSRALYGTGLGLTLTGLSLGIPSAVLATGLFGGGGGDSKPQDSAWSGDLVSRTAVASTVLSATWVAIGIPMWIYGGTSTCELERALDPDEPRRCVPGTRWSPGTRRNRGLENAGIGLVVVGSAALAAGGGLVVLGSDAGTCSSPLAGAYSCRGQWRPVHTAGLALGIAGGAFTAIGAPMWYVGRLAAAPATRAPAVSIAPTGVSLTWRM